MNKHNEFIQRATAVLQRLATVQGDMAYAMRVMAKEDDEFGFLAGKDQITRSVGRAAEQALLISEDCRKAMDAAIALEREEAN